MYMLREYQDNSGVSSLLLCGPRMEFRSLGSVTSVFFTCGAASLPRCLHVHDPLPLLSSTLLSDTRSCVHQSNFLHHLGIGCRASHMLGKQAFCNQAKFPDCCLVFFLVERKVQFIKMELFRIRIWRDGSVVKSIDCFSRGPRFRSHTHMTAHNHPYLHS